MVIKRVSFNQFQCVHQQVHIVCSTLKHSVIFTIYLNKTTFDTNVHIRITDFINFVLLFFLKYLIGFEFHLLFLKKKSKFIFLALVVYNVLINSSNVCLVSDDVIALL